MSRTISTSLTGALRLDPTTDTPVLTITSTGSIASTATGADGVDGPSSAVWNIQNSGVVSSSFGYGIWLGSAGSVIANYGAISGQRAVYFSLNGSLTNATPGVITGQSAGVVLNAGGAVANSGSIVAQASGSAGVDLEGGGSVTNSSGASITGATYGVYVNGAAGTVTNAGSISGGSYAVNFHAVNAANRLIFMPGASFSGSVAGGGGTLELASGASSFTGLGGNAFKSFQGLAVDAGGNWTLTGVGNTIANLVDNGTLNITGSLTVSGVVDASGSGTILLGAAGGGGVLDVAQATGATSGISFLGASKLIVESAAAFGTSVGSASYAGPQLQNFEIGDTIDIHNFAAANASVSYNAATGLAQISNGAQVASLSFQNSTLGAGVLQVVSDGGGGVNVSLAPVIAPTVSSVSAAAATAGGVASNTIGLGAKVTITLNLSANVDVNALAPPSLLLNDGGVASYVSGAGTNALTFQYTVGANQNTSSLAVSGVQNASSIISTVGVPADLSGADATLSFHSLPVQVNTAAPAIISITGPTGQYGPGSLVQFTVNLSEAASVNTNGGVPTLTLSNGAQATYASGSDSTALVFNYIVGAAGSSESTNGLSTAASNALALNGGAITDAAGDAAILSGADGVTPFAALQVHTHAAPSHIVVVTLENTDFSEIIGSSAAPYLNSLVSQGMLFKDYSGVTHPSQPNYLALFSGSMQGVTNDSPLPLFPSTTPTLASALQQAGLTFTGYAETGYDPGHTPWLDFANSAAYGQTFGAFPTDFNALPTVSFVTPNNNDNMHNGATLAAAIQQGDSWIQTNLSAYAQWAQANNSLLVVTFDENDDERTTTHNPNQVATIVVGAGVPQGVLNAQPANHYSLLATILGLYGAPGIAESANLPLLDLYSATPPTATTAVTAAFSGLSTTAITAKGNALAVGPNFIVSAEGSNYQYSSLSGRAATTVSLASLFAPLGAANTASLAYARSAYDSATGKFVLIALNTGSAGVSTIDIAVSKDGNPADGWDVGVLNAALSINGQATGADAPSLSVANGQIYLTAPEHFVSPSGNAGSAAWVINESSVVNGSTTVAASETTDPVAAPYMSSVVGANGVTYFVSAYSSGTQTKVAYQTYTAADGFGALQTVSLGNGDQGHGSADFSAQQAGSALALDAGDSRIQGLAYSNGYLYGVSEVLPTGALAPQLHWFKLDVSNPSSPQVVLQDNISGSTLGLDANVAVFNGSIAVDAAGDILLNFTASGPNMDPADYYTIQRAGDPTFGAPVLYQSSSAPFVQSVGATGLQNWGPNSTAIADPNNPNSFWISNEYVATAGVAVPTGLSAWWNTAIAQVQVSTGARIASAINSSLNLAPGDNPLVITSAGSVTSASSAAIAGAKLGFTWNITNAGAINSTGGAGVSLAGAGAITNSGAISGLDGLDLNLGGFVRNLAGGTISDAGVYGASIYATNAATTIDNSGAIVDTHSNAILLTAGGQITNNASGSISAKNNAAFVSGGVGALTNSGVVAASSGAGVDFESGGAITNNANASIAGAYGVFANGRGSLANSGSITGASSDGVLFTGGGTLSNAAGASIAGGADAIYFVTGAANSVANAGSVTANGGAALYLASGGVVSNAASGVMSGSDYAVFIGGGTGSVTNYGNLSGTHFDGVALAAGGAITNAAGAKILGGNNAVYISSAASGSVTNAGTITGQNAGSAGLDIEGGGTAVNQLGGQIAGLAYGVFLLGSGSVTNNGSISGAHGVSLNGSGGVTNGANASIAGQVAGVAFNGGVGTISNAGAISAGATGGAGVDLESGGSVTNLSGASISGVTYGVFSIGGPASVTNASGATISGGEALFTGSAPATVINSGSILSSGAAGADMEGGGSFTNNARGAVSGSYAGIFISGGAGAVRNAGTISGGSYAVDFATSNAANRLIVDAGATFNGAVEGGGGVLELASGTGSISGLNGGAFNDFASLAVDSGGSWSLTGASNAISTVANHGTVDIAGALQVSTAIDSSSDGLFALTGDGSTLEVASALGAQSRIAFQASSSLTIDDAAHFGVDVGSWTYTGPQLQDFGVGDTIDIHNFSLLGASLNFDSQSGLLQLTNSASQTATLDFQTPTLGTGSFEFTSDGGAGILLTRS